jgi:hypothetical protein
VHEPHANSRALRSSAAHVTQAKDLPYGMPWLRTCRKAHEPAKLLSCIKPTSSTSVPPGCSLLNIGHSVLRTMEN